MADSQKLSATLEDYLETILRLTIRNNVARVRDIAEALSVHKSTVTAALKSLAKKGLVNYTPYEIISLTRPGNEIAQKVISRHEIICQFLIEVLSVDKTRADANACRMEHVLDKEVMERLRLFAVFVKECPRAGKDWVLRFRDYFQHDGHLKRDTSDAEQWIGRFKKKLSQGKNRRSKR